MGESGTCNSRAGLNQERAGNFLEFQVRPGNSGVRIRFGNLVCNPAWRSALLSLKDGKYLPWLKVWEAEGTNESGRVAANNYCSRCLALGSWEPLKMKLGEQEHPYEVL